MAIFVVNRVPGDRENFLDYQKWPIFSSMGFPIHFATCARTCQLREITTLHHGELFKFRKKFLNRWILNFWEIIIREKCHFLTLDPPCRLNQPQSIGEKLRCFNYRNSLDLHAFQKEKRVLVRHRKSQFWIPVISPARWCDIFFSFFFCNTNHVQLGFLSILMIRFHGMQWSLFQGKVSIRDFHGKMVTFWSLFDNLVPISVLFPILKRNFSVLWILSLQVE